MIGRERELAALTDLRRELGKAHGALALVAGEAGIGKSRLLRAFAEGTRSARARLAIAQCRPFGDQPYGPIRELLEGFTSGRVTIAPADSQRAQHTRLVDAILTASERHALIGVVEDFHWADRGTASVIGLLAEQLATKRILLVVSYRNDELHEGHPLFVQLGELMRNRNARKIEIRPLTARQTGELIDETLADYAENVSRQTRRDIARASEGNPFFTEELLKDAVDRERLKRDNDLPTSVRAAILHRMEPLDERDREVLTQAAVIGRRFSGALLAQTLNATFESLLPALQRARRCQLVEETEEPDTFRFRHALTREAIYDDLLAAQRRPLHRRIAEALERAGGEAALEALAYHWWACGDREKALLYGERAGDRALQLYEYWGAADAYERTLRLLEPSSRDAARVHEKIGTTYFRAGLMDRAVEHYAPAWEFFKSTRDDPTFLFRLTRNVAGALFNDGRNAEALALWREALPAIAACGDRRIEDLSRVTFATYLIDDGEVEETLRTLEAVDDDAVGVHVESALYFWSVKAMANAYRGDRQEVRRALERLCAIPRERPMLGPLVDALGEAGMTALYIGEREGARRCLEGALDLCVRMKSSAMLLADTLLANAFERVLAGDHARARELHGEALQHIAETKVSWYRAWTIALWLAPPMGSPETRDAPDEAAVRGALRTGKVQLYGPLVASFAQSLLARGDTATARALTHDAVIAAATTRSLGSFPLTVVAARICEPVWSAQVKALAARDAVCGEATAATAQLVDAILERRFGDRADAARLARAAADGFARVGWPVFEAEALHEAHAEATPSDDGGGEVARLLSARELDVARRVANGKSNREVAADLIVSVKLVEKLLSSIYRKLGLRSRSELAARFPQLESHETFQIQHRFR